VSTGTRDKLLDVAEELFAQKGIQGTSLRVLTRAAGTNLAAVHYHFGSKDGLLDAVLERRAAAMNRERLADLARIEALAGDAPPDVEDIVRAFVAPGARALMALRDGRALLARLRGRLEGEPPEVVEKLVRKHFGSVCARFVEALERALPELSKERVALRFRFCLASLSQAFAESFELDTIPGYAPAPGDASRIEELIAFLAAGLAVGSRRAEPETDAARAGVSS
jgi:AcrR family transcriptional regulator